VQVHHDEEVANRIGPESCAAAREGISEALTGERTGQPLSRESTLFPGADVVPLTEGKTDGRDIASAQTARRGRRHWHVRTLLAREPGDPTSATGKVPNWSASGRRGAVADDERTRGVRLRHSSCEADEQCGAIRCGAGGAKGGGQGKCGPAKHAPGTEPGKRVTGAGAHNGKQQGKGRRRSSPHSSTISASTTSKRRSSNSRKTPHPVWMS